MPTYEQHPARRVLLTAICLCSFALAQRPSNDSIRTLQEQGTRPKHAHVDGAWLFRDEGPLELLVETDMRKLLRSVDDPVLQPAIATLRSPAGALLREEIAIRARGEFRKDNCSFPNILLDFSKHRSQAPILHGQLKLVSPCQYGLRYEHLLFREYLIYRLYALFTEFSFKVRMVTLRLADAEQRRKTIEMPSFLIEDIDDLARRNDCHESDAVPTHPDQTNRQQVTLIALFQYMIGNTDWAVSRRHNIRLIQQNGDSLSRPIAVPYDFDYCGLVNAPYAIPDERLGIPDVRTRLYMGPPRNLAELRHTRDIFLSRREEMRRLIEHFPELEPVERRDVWHYIEGFFEELGQRNFEAKFSIGGWGFTQNKRPWSGSQGLE